MTILMKSNLKDLNDSRRLDIIMPISVLALYIQTLKLPFPKCCIVCLRYDKAISLGRQSETSHCGEVFLRSFYCVNHSHICGITQVKYTKSFPINSSENFDKAARHSCLSCFLFPKQRFGNLLNSLLNSADFIIYSKK